jgi:hypothetical protein
LEKKKKKGANKKNKKGSKKPKQQIVKKKKKQVIHERMFTLRCNHSMPRLKKYFKNPALVGIFLLYKGRLERYSNFSTKENHDDYIRTIN